jgi:nucleoside-triphosphatase THEP1
MKASEHPSIIQFQRALRNLSLDPLITDREVERFGVEYGEDTLDELDSLIRDSDTQDSKIMFTGHTGCGKSTLLANLARRLQDDYFVTRFSIAEAYDLSGVNHVDILFATGFNMLRAASLEGIKIPSSMQKSFAEWFSHYAKVESDSGSIKGEVGVDFWKILVLKIQAERTVKDEIRKEFERNIKELVAKLNEIAATIQMASKRKSLIIIDDLDKLDLAVARPIFQDNIKSLFLPIFSIIYTLPITALRDKKTLGVLKAQTGDSITELAVSKIYAKGDRARSIDEFQPAIVNKLIDILRKRLSDDVITIENIIEHDVVQKIALASGGVLRELIRISIRCCRICLIQIRRDLSRTDIKITMDVFQEACQDIRLDFERPLGQSDYEILKQISQGNLPVSGQQQEFLDLLHVLYILEYRNQQSWYDLHPIVLDLLRLKKIIT